MIDLEGIKIKILQEEENIYDHDYEQSHELNKCFEIFYPTHNKCRISFNKSTVEKYVNRLAFINLASHLKRSVEKEESKFTVSYVSNMLNLMTQAINNYRNTRHIILEKRGKDYSND